jgi:16S rRNA (cytosine967-C5)-methyltransferase
MNARELAILGTVTVEDNHLLVPESINRILKERPLALDSRELSLAHQLIYGTFRYLPGLDRLLNGVLREDLTSLPPTIRWLLRISLYELMFLNIPHYATVDQANRLAVHFKARGLKKLVNGVLRHLLRKQSEWPKDPASMVMPEWLESLLLAQHGDRVAEWKTIWAKEPLTLFWSTQKDDPGEPFSSALPHARLSASGHQESSPFRYIQNGSSQWISHAIGRSPCTTILDYCAAPGGKSLYLSAFFPEKVVTSCDRSSIRRKKMEENRDRLQLPLTVLPLEDLAKEGSLFDLVLVDAPCSALGTISRHPEIAMLRGKTGLVGFESTHHDILQEAWKHVSPGGFLMYTICTLNLPERPPRPEGSLPADEALRAWALPLDSLVFEGDGRFFIAPSPGFDGFLGFLAQKS